ncbi:stress response membrane protein YncL [Enterobacter cloacae complex sp. P24RS]|nr:stress response membrane protein YncL [Enterobacter cloacae complex sp. P24RS]
MLTLLPVFLAHFLVGFFLPEPTKIWRFITGGETLFSVATEQQRIDNMNVSSKFVICLNLISASTLLLLLSTRFEWL